MKSLLHKITFLGVSLFIGSCAFVQDVNRTLPDGYDPHRDKIIPDKIFEIGLPLLLLFVIANTIVSVFKIKAENRLKEKAMDRQLSEQTLIALFGQDRHLAKYAYLRWFLILAAFGISLLVIQLFSYTTAIRSGYLALGIITLFMSFAFLIYYRIIRNK